MSSIARKPWTREELILAINLYCKTPVNGHPKGATQVRPNGAT